MKKYTNKKIKKAEDGIQPLTPENPIPRNMNFNPEGANPYSYAYKPINPNQIPTAPQIPPFQPSTTNDYSTPQDRPDNNINRIQPINQNRTQTSFGIKGKFNTADMTAGIIAGINSLLPDQRKKDNINKLQLGYNPFPQGDNSSAVFADGGVIPENWQALHSYAYQHDPNYGSQDYNHGQFATPILEQYNQANPSQAIQPSQIPDYQQYLQQQASINPNRVSAPQGLSPIDAKYGPKTQTSNLRSWDLIHNNEAPQHFGPHPEELAKAQAKLNSGFEDYGKPKEWQSNNQGNPVANTQPEIVPIQPIQRQQKSNYHTDEDTNYSIDSIREETAKDGIHIKPSHKGRFTAYKQRTGKTTEEALHSKDPHVRQMANFSRNAKKWHHAEDGYNWDIPPYPLDAENGINITGSVPENKSLAGVTPTPYIDEDIINNAKMKGKIAISDAMGNPDTHRMVQNYPQQYTFTGNEQIPQGFDHPEAGSIGSHFMGSYGNYAIPSIQKSGDSLRFNPNPRPTDKGAIKFNNEQDAEYFGEHYKEVAPMMRNWNKYENGGQINYLEGSEHDLDINEIKRLEKLGYRLKY